MKSTLALIIFCLLSRQRSQKLILLGKGLDVICQLDRKNKCSYLYIKNIGIWVWEIRWPEFCRFFQILI